MEKKDTYHPDHEIFLRFCDRSREATQQIYQDHFDQIRRLVRRFGGKEEDAEDIFQSGLLALLKYCDRKNFVLSKPLGALLYGICSRMLWRRLEKRKRLNIQSQDFSQYVDLKKTLELQEEELRRAEQWQLIDKHLHRLPEKERQVLKLFYQEGKSLQEIADIVGFASANSAKVQKFKYLQHLIERTSSDPDFE